MKYFITLSTVLLAASAMPTQFGNDADVIHDALEFNATRNMPSGLFGFAALNGGTVGGAGGAVWTVWDAWALRDAVSGNDRRLVYVRGHIDLTALFVSSPGVWISVGSWKTILGGDRDATIFGGGMHVQARSQVIFHNMKFHNALSYAPGERPDGNGFIANQVAGAWSNIDPISIDNSVNVWVNHCNFADDPWIANNTPENRRRHNGLISIWRGANWVTISNNIFRNHNMNILVGHDDNNAAQDNGRLKVTFYRNWFQGVTQRNPRVRFGEVHVLNNLYTDISSYGIGIGVQGKVYAERNSFINTGRSWAWASNAAQGGALFNFNNLLTNSGHESGIPANVGWVPTQYYSYTAMAAANVEAHVRTFAGFI